MEIIDVDEIDDDVEETETNEEDNDDHNISRRYTCPIAPRLQSTPTTLSSSINKFDIKLIFIVIIMIQA